MDQINILIAYGSRYGCTEEISHIIAEFLEKEEGFMCTLLNLRTTEEDLWPSIERYDGIMIGTGIRIGKWTKEAQSLLKKCKQNNNIKSLITGVFISCGYASDPNHYPIAIRDFLERVFVQVGIKPNIYDAFGGVFDFSHSSKKGFLDRGILKWGSKSLSMKTDYSKRNDFRNWSQIYDFGSRFAKLLWKK
ncbi:MAG: flavodoxin domain-containing protein [Candidatus Hodarchaeota archaeon]